MTHQNQERRDGWPRTGPRSGAWRVSSCSGDDRPWVSPWAVAGLAWLLCGASLTLGILGLVLESLNGHRITDSLVVGPAGGLFEVGIDEESWRKGHRSLT